MAEETGWAVGPQTIGDGGGGSARARLSRTGEVMIGYVHPRYYEQTRRGNRFYAASQSAVTTTVALATTYTGLVVYNPVASGVFMSIDKAGFALSVAPVAIATLGLITGYSAAGIATHTTPLTSMSGLFVGNAAGVGKADAAATLVGTPQWTMQMAAGFTAGALYGAGAVGIDVEGAIVLPPGGYCAIGSLTAVIGFGYIQWSEIPYAGLAASG